MQRFLCAGGVFATTLALYIWTLAPTVTLVDSGELIVAAHGLGVPHPPGFPLYVLLAHVATLLPVGNVAMRVNFASALFAALAAALLTAVMTEMLLTTRLALRLQPRASPGTRPRKQGNRPKDLSRETRESEGRVGTAMLVIPALVAAWLLAFSRTLWAYATIVEVYTLNTLLLIGIFLLMFRWRRSVMEGTLSRGLVAAQQARMGVGAESDGWLHAAAFVFGLALGVHHVTVGLALPGLAALVYATAGPRFFTSKRLVYAALCGLTGLAVYVYLPIAASREPVLNWGDPRTWQRVWWHVTGRQYQSYFSFSPGELGSEAVDYVRRVSREFGPWWVPAGPLLAVIGLVALWRRDRVLLWFLVLVVGSNLAYGLSYIIAEDKDAYYLPTVLCLAIAAGYGASRVMYVASSRGRAAGLVAASVVLVPMVALAGNFRFNDRSQYFIARDYVENILSTVAPGGTLLTLDWQVCSPMLYTRAIEAYRPDVVVIDVNLLRRSWYFHYLRREYPSLIERARAEVDAFLEDLEHWEQDPSAYAHDVRLTQRIDSRFYDMILAFVRRQIGSAPVYITQDIALARDAENGKLAQALAAAYQFVPQGLLFQLIPDGAFHEPAEPQLLTRGLADGSLQFEADDVVRLKVFPVYVSMLFNRGRYLALNGRHERAVEAFKQALALDPHFGRAQQALADSLKALRDAQAKRE